MSMSAIEIDSYGLWFHVKTEHDYRLEFVLDYEEEREELTHAYFTDALWDALRASIPATSDTQVDEYSLYGNVSYHIVANSLEELTDALARCEKAAALWIEKHNVNDMKDEP